LRDTKHSELGNHKNHQPHDACSNPTLTRDSGTLRENTDPGSFIVLDAPHIPKCAQPAPGGDVWHAPGGDMLHAAGGCKPALILAKWACTLLIVRPHLYRHTPALLMALKMCGVHGGRTRRCKGSGGSLSASRSTTGTLPTLMQPSFCNSSTPDCTCLHSFLNLTTLHSWRSIADPKTQTRVQACSGRPPETSAVMRSSLHRECPQGRIRHDSPTADST
jgi:hypothetical protein